MIADGNTKLGLAIHSFSIPASGTCPGKTKLCAKHCYAKKGHFVFESVDRVYRENLRQTRRADFANQILAELRKKPIRTLRLHASGDFYSATYVEKWIKIAKARPDVAFFAYTRSWRVPEILPALRKLAKLRNVRMWWSTDADTHRKKKPPKQKGVRVAYMQSSHGEQVPAYVDLVFRVRRDRVSKYVPVEDRQVLVCPAEQGVSAERKITCTDCKLCYGLREIPHKQLLQLAG